MRKYLLLAVAFLPLAGWSQLSETDRDLFEFCVPNGQVDLIVLELDDIETEGGLTTERIENVVESRLRAARIYAAEASSILIVHVSLIAPLPNNATSLAGFFRFNLARRMTTAEGIVGVGVTAFTTIDYAVSGGADYIMQGISEAADQFVREFLRVNESEECRLALRE